MEPAQYPLVNSPRLGEQSQTFYQKFEAASGATEIQYWFYWRDRNVIARVLVAGSPALTEGEAVGIAEGQARIITRR